MFRSIVVGTDGSATAQRAVATAARLAKAVGAEVHVVSAHNPLGSAQAVAAAYVVADIIDPTDGGVRDVVDEAVAAVRASGVDAHGHAVVGDPVSALLEVAQRESADLVVVGNRGMHGLKRALGSVPNSISHRAACSVLIVSTDSPD